MGETMGLVRNILAGHPVLGALPTEDLDRLAQRVITRTYRPGQSVFMKGDPGTTLMAVLRGRVRISCIAADGREIVLAVLDPGEVFGEIAMIDGGERTADAVALEDAELLILHRRDFLPVLEANPRLALRLLEILAGRLRRTDQQIEDNYLPLRPRLAKRLLFLADHYGKPVENGTGVQIAIRLPQTLLASMVGTTREAVNKQLGEFRNAGLIDMGRGTITVRDRDGLEEVVIDGM